MIHPAEPIFPSHWLLDTIHFPTDGVMTVKIPRIRELWKNINHFYDELYFAPYRQSIRRQLRDEEDVFMLLTCSEMLGIPNPLTYYTLELIPYMLEEYHAWHRRMGYERSPLDEIRCC